MGSIELDLPRKDSVDIHLVVATPHEIHAQQLANSVEWKGPLSIEAYHGRENYVLDQELTRNGGATCWVLVYTPDPRSPRKVLCGCETINKRGLLAKAGKVEEATVHAVHSVFCPSDLRGRGYAGRMVEELGRKLEKWQAKNGKSTTFSVLFSDIGKVFYAARGWQVFPSAHLALPASESPVPEGVRLLNSHDLSDLCAYDEELVRRRLAGLETSGRTAVALAPDFRTARWHHAREDFVANELYGKTPAVKGAMVGDTPGSRVWAYWTRAWTNPQEASTASTLYILRLVIEDDTINSTAATSRGADAAQDSHVARAIAAIFTVAQSEAARWDMKEVSAWNPNSATLAAAQSIDPNVQVVHRVTSSINSLRWYGEGTWKDVDWLFLEKYTWC